MNLGITLAEAWEKTIRKWSTKDQDFKFFTTPDNCGLCNKFLRFNNGKSSCAGCPIAKLTKHKTCDRFPAYRKMLKLDYCFRQDEIERVREEGLAWLLKIKAKSEQA
jgi:hypothetical protein